MGQNHDLIFNYYFIDVSLDECKAITDNFHFFPGLCFQELPVNARHFKRPEGQIDPKYDRYLQGSDSKSNLRGDVGSLWLIGWAMLDLLYSGTPLP